MVCQNFVLEKFLCQDHLDLKSLLVCSRLQ